MAKLSFQDQQELIRILIGYGRLDVSLRRTNFFFMTGLQDEAPDLISQIPIEGDVATFCQKMVPTINQYGLLPSGDSAILRVVQYMQGEVRGHPPLVRTLESMEAGLKISGRDARLTKANTIPPVPSVSKVVALFANPISLQNITVEEEERVLRGVLNRHRNFGLTTILRTRLVDLTGTLDTIHPVIFHYSGHADEDGLQIDAGDGVEARTIPWDTLAEELRHNPNLACVVLNGCKSGQQAFSDGFMGNAPYIIAMQDSIGTERAKVFAERFYQVLVAGDTFEVAFAKAKNALSMSGYQDAKDIPILIPPTA